MKKATIEQDRLVCLSHRPYTPSNHLRYQAKATSYALPLYTHTHTKGNTRNKQNETMECLFNLQVAFRNTKPVIVLQ
ncbi:hypothetical protein SK128_027208, partial [Halocaridina rubra]